MLSRVKIQKTEWEKSSLEWLKHNMITGMYGFNQETLEPDYTYFEFLFIDPEDAIMFALLYKK